jgi:hypothetical protein
MEAGSLHEWTHSAALGAAQSIAGHRCRRRHSGYRPPGLRPLLSTDQTPLRRGAASVDAAPRLRGVFPSQRALSPRRAATPVPEVKQPELATPLVAASISRSELGAVIGEYSAIEPGPLADRLAGTFAGGRYKTVVLDDDTVLYRAGTISQPLGQFFSAEQPSSVIQTRMDKAILPTWPGGGASPLDTSFAIKIPAVHASIWERLALKTECTLVARNK